MPTAGQWRWPALTMFTVGFGANQFVPLLAVYRKGLSPQDARPVSSTSIPGSLKTGTTY